MSVRLPLLLSDGMVLQRGAEVRLRGTADEPVTVTFLKQKYYSEPDRDGVWEVVLNDLEPGGPYTLSVNEVTIRDVYVGDVWLCSGQSNMQLPMLRVRHMYSEEFKECNPNIRQFTVPQRVDFSKPNRFLDGGSWQGAAPETIQDFSAVGYFFAKRLYERYRVPVGLILSAIGGTPIHAWMSRGSLEDFPELIEEADRFADDSYIRRVQSEDAKSQQEFFDGIDATDPGLAHKWYSTDYDDSGWEECELTKPWTGTGSVWFRKTLRIPPDCAGKPATLFLGTIVDWDTVYVNGKIVGNTTYRYPPREYMIPSLPEGRCVIAIRVISKDGGCFTPGKQYLLATDSGSFNLNGAWRFHRGGHGSPVTAETFFHYKPTGLYNGMIAPLKDYAIKGVIWYQGESDTSDPHRYADKFESLVKSWRSDWGYAFPFIFVELAHWEHGKDWDLLRQQQWLSLRVPNTAMAAAFDLGEHNDLHPLGKQAVGDRLARCAVRIAYGEKMPHSPFEIVGLNCEP